MSTATGSRPARLPELEPFLIELDRFQGPLDLLLHLIRSQDIDIFDIPVARITEQFLRALESGLEGMPLERAGEFLELAATLVRIKAQLLLPRPGEPEWEEDPRSDLVRRLLEYEHFQDVVHFLASAEAQRGRHHAKGYVEPRPPPAVLRPRLELTLEEFLEVAGRLPEPLAPPRVRPAVRTVSVEEKISLVRRLIRKAKRVPFERLFRPWGTRSHAVAALLATLELARQQLVRIEQVKPFGSIWLLRARGAGRNQSENGADGQGRESGLPAAPATEGES